MLALPGCDCGRYSKECWLFTLGVLHPGVPFMWQAESCKGGRLPKGNKVALGVRQRWCKGSDGLVVVGWLGKGTTTLHCTRRTDATGSKLSLFFLPSLPGPVVGEMPSATIDFVMISVRLS